MRPRKEKEVMSEIVRLRLTPEKQQQLSEVYPGSQPGTINPDKLRAELDFYSGLTQQVLNGDISLEAATGKMKTHLEFLIEHTPQAQQVYMEDKSSKEGGE